MNFKRYHVSKNLFDISQITSGVVLNPDNGEEFTNVNYYSSDYIWLSAGSYTLSMNNEYTGAGNTTNRVIAYNSNKAYLNALINVTDSRPLQPTYNFTLESDSYIRITVRNTDINVMLNSGSQPLPYEPYSSEVWHDTPHYVHNTSTDTITTLPAVLYPNDTTATAGLKGNMEQSGTPTPTTPIQPQECGDLTGNLAWTGWGQDYVTRINDRNKASMTSNVLTFSANAGYGEYDTKYIFKTDWKSSQQYTISFKYKRSPSQSNATIFCIHYTDGSTSNFPGLINDGAWHDMSYTSTNGKTIKYITPYYSSGSIDVDVDTFMVNEDSTALPYEPYGVKIPILNNSQTTNVYLGEVESTRQIKKYEFTGAEALQTSGSGNARFFYLSIADARSWAAIIGDRYVNANISSTSEDIGIAMSGNSQFRIRPDLTSTVNDFKTYLQQQYAAGTPVTIWYILATSTTGIVNEPIRKIGEYADTVSNISIPTIAGANTLSIGTTVQPSEVTATYKGWHSVQSVHEYDSNYTIATMQALTIAQLQTHTISDLQGGEWS